MKQSPSCLSANDVAAIFKGALAPGQATMIEQHLAECSICREKIESDLNSEQWLSEMQLALLAKPDNWNDEIPNGDGSRVAERLLQLLGPTDDPEMLGRIGSYEIKGVLGHGGMGVVFKGFDRSLNRFVAIKMLLPHLAASTSARKRFSREAQAIAAVVDDHVMPVHFVGEWQDVPYLVMPYSKGVSLQTRLKDEGALQLAEILRIGTQAATGLAAAHAQGIVHRDIKPANIFLSENVERVQLMDFGLARAADDASLTRTGIVAGTPLYMSPEQARAEKVDTRSDLFSLGSVLYTMCTGRAPFLADSSHTVLRLITDQAATPIQQINSEIPIWLCRVVERLMAKSTVDRYQSAQDVAEHLENCLAHVQDPDSVALPESLTTAPQRRFGTKTIGASVAAIAIVVAAVFWNIFGHTAAPDDQHGPWVITLARQVGEQAIPCSAELQMTHAEILKSDFMIQRALNAIDSKESVDSIRSKLTIELTDGSKSIRIAFAEGPSPPSGLLKALVLSHASYVETKPRTIPFGSLKLLQKEVERNKAKDVDDPARKKQVEKLEREIALVESARFNESPLRVIVLKPTGVTAPANSSLAVKPESNSVPTISTDDAAENLHQKIAELTLVIQEKASDSITEKYQKYPIRKIRFCSKNDEATIPRVLIDDEIAFFTTTSMQSFSGRSTYAFGFLTRVGDVWQLNQLELGSRDEKEDALKTFREDHPKAEWEWIVSDKAERRLFAWNDKNLVAPNAEFFPNDKAKGLELDKMSFRYSSPGSDDALQTIRSGLRNSTNKRKIFNWITNKYFHNPEASVNNNALQIAYNALDLDYETQRHAIFALNALDTKPPKVQRALAEFLVKHNVSLGMLRDVRSRNRRSQNDQLGKAQPNKGQSRIEEFLNHLRRYENSVEPAFRKRALTIRLRMDGVSNLSIETIRVLVNHRFGQYLAELKRVLFEGSSENRQRILDFVLGEHIYLIMDESFVPALAKCASDESRDVRYLAPFVIGQRLRWHLAADNQRELNRRDEANSIALLMKLSKDNDAPVRRGAATFLRDVPEKNDDVFERLVELAITEREPDRLGTFGLRDEKERVQAWLYKIISKPKSKELQAAALIAHEELYGSKTTIDEARKKAEQFDNREFNNTDSDAANSDTSINNVSPASNDPVVLTAFGETISLTGLLPVDAHLKHKQLSPAEYEEWLIQARGITAYDRIWHAVRQQFINTKKLHHTSTELASIDAYLNHHAATNWKHLSDIEREKRIADAVTIARLTHMNWKVCKALHAQHGGRVGTNQTGAWIAFDAQNKLLKQHIDTGVITIHDSEVEAAFWSHTKNERFADAIPTGSQLQELLSIPPYVRSSSVNLPSE